MPKNCKTPHGKPSRARVMWGDPDHKTVCNVSWHKTHWASSPGAFIPCATHQSARALVKLAKMTREQRVEAVRSGLMKSGIFASKQDAAIIDALYFGAREDGQ